MLGGCVVGSPIETKTVKIDERTLVYKSEKVSKNSHILRIWSEGIVFLPDMMHESALQMRGAEIAMKDVCGSNAQPKIVNFRGPEGNAADTEILFLCDPLAKEKKATDDKGSQI